MRKIVRKEENKGGRQGRKGEEKSIRHARRREKLPLIIPYYDKLVREYEVKFDISRLTVCVF